MKIKMDHVGTLVAAAVAGLILFGSWSIFGGGFVGSGVAVVVMAMALWFGKRVSDEDDQKLAEAHRKLCAERVRTYDGLVDQGVNVLYNDKPWVKGSQIDPATNAMIEPTVSG